MRLNVESVRFKVGAVYIFRLLYTMGHKYRASGRPGDWNLSAGALCLQKWSSVHLRKLESTRYYWRLHITREFRLLAWTLLHFTFLTPGIWKWFLDFWKIRVSLL